MQLKAEQTAIRILFALAVGVAGGVAALALGIAFDASAAWFSEDAHAMYVLPLAGVLELALYRILNIPVDADVRLVVCAARAGEGVPVALGPAIFMGTCMSVLFGASVGKEAAAVQLCAAAACGLCEIARYAGMRTQRRWCAYAADDRVALACGMAAGISALFEAPLAGALFALELVGVRAAYGLGRRRWASCGALALVSSVAACAVARAIGSEPFVPEAVVHLLSCGIVPDGSVQGAFVLAAVLLASACAGAVYVRVSDFAHDALSRRKWNPYAVVAIGGAAVVLATSALGLTRFCGSGFALLPAAFLGQASLCDALVKALLTLVILGCGFKGGEIMPVLATGALLGSALGVAAGAAAGVDVSAAWCAVFGMLAFFAAAKRCPLAACALGLELFVLPLL